MALDEVKSWMSWWGWSAGGGPGSLKVDGAGLVVARHGDAVWNADVDRALEIIHREHRAHFSGASCG